MIQQLLLWANFWACFCFSPVNQQLAGNLAALMKAVIFNLGMQVSDFPLRLMQLKDLMPHHSEILISVPDLFHLKPLLICAL